MKYDLFLLFVFIFLDIVLGVFLYWSFWIGLLFLVMCVFIIFFVLVVIFIVIGIICFIVGIVFLIKFKLLLCDIKEMFDWCFFFDEVS